MKNNEVVIEITEVICREFEVIYFKQPYNVMNVEHNISLDNSIEKQLSYRRLLHFKADFDAVGKWLCKH